MKIAAAAFMGGALLVSCEPKESASNAPVELNSELDTVCYALGMSISNQLKNDGLKEFNEEAMTAAIADVFAGRETKLTEGEINGILQSYFTKIREEESRARFQEVLEQGEAFLEENAKREGVITTSSGLQYEVIEEGTGAKPAATDKVKVHYEGTLIDGTVFDSSYDRGEPIEFMLNMVIPGWTEGVQLMTVGSKYKFYIPYQLGYGDRQAGELIKPFSTLVFTVELLDITTGQE